MHVLESRASVFVWDHEMPVSSHRHSARYANGHVLFREWISPGKSTIGVTSRRVYFENGSNWPSSHPFVEFLKLSDVPRLPTPSSRLKACTDLMSHLATKVAGLDPQPLAPAQIRTGLEAKTRLLGGDGCQSELGTKRGAMLQRGGFFNVPDQFEVVVTDEYDASKPAAKYAEEISRSMRRTRCPGRVSVIPFANVLRRLTELEAGDQPRGAGKTLLIGVRGKRGDALSVAAQELIRRLDRYRLPYRLFSLENKSMNWSAFDQLGSLIQAAGGQPYVLSLPWPTHLTDSPFLVGVDVGHPLGVRESWVTLSLLDHRGVHLQSWRCKQDRDETIAPAVLRAGLTWVRDRIIENGGNRNTPVIVVRDGRLHSGEKLHQYREGLGFPLSLVEIDKRRNPELFIAGSQPMPVSAGTECSFGSGMTRFIVPVGARMPNDLPRVLKIVMTPEMDGLHLGMDAMSELIVGLSYSPALGLQPHTLPGPIYWADGIAAIGETNHQFSGQNITYAGTHELAAR